MDNKELYEWMKQNLYTAVVCDILDTLGYRNQAMHHRLRPLDEANCVFAGRARTVRWMEVDYFDPENPYGREIEFMDSLGEDDVIIHSTDHSGTNAPWGELMSTAATVHKAAGCVCDSQIRDCVRIKKIGFPVFYTGIRPLDSSGRGLVVDYDVPVHCGEVLVHPGELVFADFDGVVVVPGDVEEEVLRLAHEKAGAENSTRRELLEGRSLQEVYHKYGAL